MSASTSRGPGVTSTSWTNRILGRTQMLTVPNTAMWMLTGNNPKLSKDIARSSIRIRIDPKVDRAWTRASFEHWAAVMGGVLSVAGVEGFLGNLDELYANADVESEAWREFTLAWWDAHGPSPARVSDRKKRTLYALRRLGDAPVAPPAPEPPEDDDRDEVDPWR